MRSLIVGTLLLIACAQPVITIPGATVTPNTDYRLVPSKGCSDEQVRLPKYAPTTTTDSIDRYTSIASPLVRMGDVLGTSLYLSTNKIIKPPAEPYYSLYAMYGAKDWLFIEKGNNLTVMADGQRIELSTDAVERRVGSGISENLVYVITEQQLKDIAGAEAVTMRLRGERGSQDFHLTTDAICTLRRFTLDAL